MLADHPARLADVELRWEAAGFGEITYGTNSFSVNVIPDPSSFALLGLGAGALLVRRRRASMAI